MLFDQVRSMDNAQPVLILGAGINGAAIARELVLNNVPVVVVDQADLASGTTSYSSRLIHGGLRYLEYGELGLVRESLHERQRWLRLAPHLVQPLQLFIPVARRFSGFGQALRRLTRCCPEIDPPPPRGLWLVRTGLALYDLIARDPTLPRHRVLRAASAGAPPVDPQQYPWLCSYWDAQIAFPERMVVEQLQDARRVAQQRGLAFEVLPYHRVEMAGRQAIVQPIDAQAGQGTAMEFEPAGVINATGAWVDETLKRLHLPAERLMGGTKGSHLWTSQRPLRDALAGNGIYTEAIDGRPFFLLPFGEMTLIGTTDIPYEGPPEKAVASEEEIEYLLASTRRALPHVGLQRCDIDLHYSGVRPLPYTGAGRPASITRRHFVHEHPAAPLPMWSVVGGKLTTCRSLAEEAAKCVLSRLDLPVVQTSRHRPLPGGQDWPDTPDALCEVQEQLAHATGATLKQVQSAWRLWGQTAAHVLQAPSTKPSDADAPWTLAGSDLPVALVRYSLRHEWVNRLADLVERRLMLLYTPALPRDCLQHLAQLMVEEGKLEPSQVSDEIDAVIQRCHQHFGKTIR
ncbi:MAG: glycerol-3-phosphate dehydrogenase/oxidase [Planctomycetota bacterium]|nr:MAG: glycerol-3-phosphate dehydrogenase/oxidase [Planctomycetota bacterium]